MGAGGLGACKVLKRGVEYFETAVTENRPIGKRVGVDSFSAVQDTSWKGYFTGSYSEIAVAQFNKWTPKTVLQRGLTMVDFIETRWNISLGTRADKLKLLNLEFLEPSPPDTSASQEM